MTTQCWTAAIGRDADRIRAAIRHEPEPGAVAGEGAAGAPDLEELWRRRVAEDRRYWEPGASGASAPAAAKPDVEWLWKTIRDAARGG